MQYKKILCSIVLVGIYGCHPQQMPQKVLNYPSQSRNGVKYTPDQADIGHFAWWKALHDPQLNLLISQALAENNTIQSANERILQAQAQLKSAQFAWIPTLDASAQGFMGGTWNTHITPQGAFTNTPFFSNLSNLQFQGYSAGFVPSYTLNILNTVYQVKSAKASLEIQCAQAQAARLAVISQTAGSYFMLLSQRAQLKLEYQLVRDLKELHHLEQIRYNKGANDIERVTNLDQQVAQEKIKIPQIESTIAQTENAIQVLLNQNPGPIPTSNNLMAIQTHHLVPKCLPASVLKNRPDIMISLNNMKVAKAQIGIAYAAFFPSISLTSLVGRASLELEHLLKLSTAFWVGQAQAATKLINLSSYQNIKAARAYFYSVYYDYLQTLRSAFADVDNTLTYEQKTRMAYIQAQKAYNAARSTHRIALSQYRSGAKDYRDSVNAKINADRLALNVVQLKAQLLDSIVQVYTAVASGSFKG